MVCYFLKSESVSNDFFFFFKIELTPDEVRGLFNLKDKILRDQHKVMQSEKERPKVPQKKGVPPTKKSSSSK